MFIIIYKIKDNLDIFNMAHKGELGIMFAFMITLIPRYIIIDNDFTALKIAH